VKLLGKKGAKMNGTGRVKVVAAIALAALAFLWPMSTSASAEGFDTGGGCPSSDTQILIPFGNPFATSDQQVNDGVVTDGSGSKTVKLPAGRAALVGMETSGNGSYGLLCVARTSRERADPAHSKRSRGIRPWEWLLNLVPITSQVVISETAYGLGAFAR